MADQKANMLLGVSSVVLALVVRDGNLANLQPPMLILCLTVFLSALFCLLAVLPAVGNRPPSAGKDSAPNLLFFGVFTELEEPDFQARLRDVMVSEEDICATMVRDIYQQGMVLKAKKYRYLGYAYRIFITGLLITFVTLAFTLPL